MLPSAVSSAGQHDMVITRHPAPERRAGRCPTCMAGFPHQASMLLLKKVQKLLERKVKMTTWRQTKESLSSSAEGQWKINNCSVLLQGAAGLAEHTGPKQTTSLMLSQICSSAYVLGMHLLSHCWSLSLQKASSSHTAAPVRELSIVSLLRILILSIKRQKQTLGKRT